MLRIDNREFKLIAALGPKILTVASLPIGDIWLMHPERPEDVLVIFERKTFSDLDASFKDGRYREQKNRLLTSPCLRRGYILEGTKTPSPANYGFIVNTLLRDNMMVIRTMDLNDTAQTLMTMVKNWPKYSDALCHTPPKPDSTEADAAGSALAPLHTPPPPPKFFQKKHALTPQLLYLQQLSLVPGLSMESAQAIAAVYPSLPALFAALTATPELVSEIKRGNKRLGKKQVETLLNYFQLAPETTPSPTRAP